MFGILTPVTYFMNEPILRIGFNVRLIKYVSKYSFDQKMYGNRVIDAYWKYLLFKHKLSTLSTSCVKYFSDYSVRS